MPKVTVLMPTYNVATWVEEAIRSVLRQTYRDFELLVVDDASTDNTLEVVRTIDDPHIHIASFPDNVGLADNLNRGLDLIDTELVARMDGDDIAEPWWLEHEVAYLNCHPEVGICSGGFERFGTVKSLVRFPECHADCMANMLFECSVIVPTFRMSLVRDHGLRYKSQAFPAEDYRFWAECLRVTQMHNLQETLFQYRMHPKQICTSRRHEQERKVAEVRLYMLEWLSTDFSPAEKDYYIGPFMAKEIVSNQDLTEREAFASKIIEKNRQVGHFDESALRRRLQKQLLLTTYHTVNERYFKGGYSLGRYMRYLGSGLALKTNCRYEVRFLLKSLLFKKA